MIYLTGDTHIPLDIKKLNTKNFPEQRTMTRNDYVIVLGDFGLLWKHDNTYEYWKNWLEQKNFTVLWIDGNHENHQWLNSLPVETWNGGKIHKISDNILHLMRGQVFTLEGSAFFTCGGATSYDKAQRTVGLSWWPEEDISYREIDEALLNLENIGNKVDYVLTHTCPQSLEHILYENVTPDPTGKFLDEIKSRIGFRKWYFGHHHVDKVFHEDDRFRCLYHDIIKIGD